MSIAEAKGGDGAAAGSADDVLPIVIIGGLTAAPERAPRAGSRVNASSPAAAIS
jgi:hypothetical protein